MHDRNASSFQDLSDIFHNEKLPFWHAPDKNVHLSAQDNQEKNMVVLVSLAFRTSFGHAKSPRGISTKALYNFSQYHCIMDF